jgi:PAS domain S-box-containing protein
MPSARTGPGPATRLDTSPVRPTSPFPCEPRRFDGWPTEGPYVRALGMGESLPADDGALFRVVVSSAPDAILTIDEAGTILFVNGAAERLTGYTALEMVGQPLQMLIPARLRGQHAMGIARYLTTGVRQIPWQGLRLPVLTKSGSEIPVEVSFGEYLADGRRSFPGFLRDVSERVASEQAFADAHTQLQEQALELEAANEELQAANQELEATNEELRVTAAALAKQSKEAERAAAALREREHQLRTLADAIPTLAWTAIADGYIDWYNQRWYEYTGTSAEEMEGWGWQRVHDPAALPQVLDRWKASIATGEPFEMTFPLRGADGSFRAFLTRVIPVRDFEGRVVRWFGTNTDVQAERTAREAAEEANRVKSDFLATMSHELRTPLNAIAGYAELLEVGVHGPLTDGQRESINRIQRSQRHLMGLINDVLNFAKLEAGRVEYDITDVVVIDAVDALEPLIAPQLRAKQLRFERTACADDLVVRADWDRLQQILVNLISNAIRFTPAGGTVTLECESRGPNGIITVADTGIGIPADRLEDVFAPFVQLDRRLYAPHEGTGLGLAISRDLARAMGGDLTAESSVGAGSTFILELPRR